MELVVAAIIVLVVVLGVVLRIALRDRWQAGSGSGPYDKAGPTDFEEPQPGRPAGTRKIT